MKSRGANDGAEAIKLIEEFPVRSCAFRRSDAPPRGVALVERARSRKY
jgi:hypothetical protein